MLGSGCNTHGMKPRLYHELGQPQTHTEVHFTVQGQSPTRLHNHPIGCWVSSAPSFVEFEGLLYSHWLVQTTGCWVVSKANPTAHGQVVHGMITVNGLTLNCKVDVGLGLGLTEFMVKAGLHAMHGTRDEPNCEVAHLN